MGMIRSTANDNGYLLVQYSTRRDISNCVFDTRQFVALINFG